MTSFLWSTIGWPADYDRPLALTTGYWLASYDWLATIGNYALADNAAIRYVIMHSFIIYVITLSLEIKSKLQMGQDGQVDPKLPPLNMEHLSLLSLGRDGLNALLDLVTSAESMAA